MSASQSHIICVTCKRPLPEGTTQDESPRYFGQYGLLPEQDDGENWAYEADTITGYIEAVSFLAQMTRESADPPYYALVSLIHELSEEAKRRIELCRDAMGNVWERDQAAKKAHPTQDKGRA